MATCGCGHPANAHAPCGKCLVEGCDCELFERGEPVEV